MRGMPFVPALRTAVLAVSAPRVRPGRSRPVRFLRRPCQEAPGGGDGRLATLEDA